MGGKMARRSSRGCAVKIKGSTETQQGEFTERNSWARRGEPGAEKKKQKMIEKKTHSKLASGVQDISLHTCQRGTWWKKRRSYLLLQR